MSRAKYAIFEATINISREMAICRLQMSNGLIGFICLICVARAPVCHNDYSLVKFRGSDWHSVIGLGAMPERTPGRLYAAASVFLASLLRSMIYWIMSIIIMRGELPVKMFMRRLMFGFVFTRAYARYGDICDTWLCNDSVALASFHALLIWAFQT